MVLRDKKRNYGQSSIEAGAWVGRWMEWYEVHGQGSFFGGNTWAEVLTNPTVEHPLVSVIWD